MSKWRRTSSSSSSSSLENVCKVNLALHRRGTPSERRKHTWRQSGLRISRGGTRATSLPLVPPRRRWILTGAECFQSLCLGAIGTRVSERKRDGDEAVASAEIRPECGVMNSRLGHLTRGDNGLTNKPLSARACRCVRACVCVSLWLMIVICRKCFVPLNACYPDEVNDIIFCHLTTNS